MAERLQERALPDCLIVSYDRLRGAVLLAEFIEGEALVLDRLKKRAPLAETARRAGWTGATIDLSGLERHVVVGPSFDPEVQRWKSVQQATGAS
jgi:hypothetical protein